MSSTVPTRLVCSLDEERIWEIGDATPLAKLYLLALRRSGDCQQACEMAKVPVDRVRVLEAWLLARGYAELARTPMVVPAGLAA
jgi:hypothetical protein